MTPPRRRPTCRCPRPIFSSPDRGHPYIVTRSARSRRRLRINAIASGLPRCRPGRGLPQLSRGGFPAAERSYRSVVVLPAGVVAVRDVVGLMAVPVVDVLNVFVPVGTIAPILVYMVLVDLELVSIQVSRQHLTSRSTMSHLGSGTLQLSSVLLL
jgi:hypothetical protein